MSYTIKNLRETKDQAPDFGLSEVQEARFPGKDLGAETIGLAYMRVLPGKRQGFAHRHEDAEEIYVVLSGSGRVKLDEEIEELGPLDALRVAPAVTRQFEAGPDGMEFVVFGPDHGRDGEMIREGFWTTLAESLLLRPAGDRLEGTIEGTWWTPRGPLGGYVMALMMAGMRTVVEDGRQPRSITVSFLRPPAEGAFELRPVLERAGRSLSTVSARMEQDGKPVALALGSFSPAWPGPTLEDLVMPVVEAPDDARAPAPGPGGLARPGSDPRRSDENERTPPPFVQHMTMQPRFGEPPFSGASEGLTGGWLGLRERREVDAETILILADAWYPAPWPRLTELAPAPTIEMSVYFRSPLPLADSLLLGRFHCHLVRDGFFEEDGVLWAPDGTLVAQSRQLGLLLGA